MPAPLEGGRHPDAVYHAELGGKPCVLKKYQVGPACEKQVLKQVRLLSELHHPYLARLGAVFLQHPTCLRPWAPKQRAQQGKVRLHARSTQGLPLQLRV